MLAINGLRDGNLKRELMATRGLDWKELTRLLKARSVTRLAVEELDEDTDGATPITMEVSVVYNNTRVAHMKLVIIMKPLIAIILIVVTPIATWVKQSVTLVVNIIMIPMICLVAADHPLIVVDNLIQGEVMAVMGSMRASGQKEVMTFALLFHIFMEGMGLVMRVTHVGSLLKIILVVVNP